MECQVNQIIVDKDTLFSCDVAGSLLRWNWRRAKDYFAEDVQSPQLQPVAFRRQAHSNDINGIALHSDTNKLFSCGKDNKIKVAFVCLL
jgi:WD40 repeat protein